MEKELPDVVVDGKSLTIEDVVAVARGGAAARLTEDQEILGKAAESREFYLASGVLAYGDNLAVGANVTKTIPQHERKAFQARLIDSLSCGVGEALPCDIVRAAMLLRANSLLKEGCSAIGLDKIQRVIELLNHGILPIIHEDGSVCASGDLVPLASLAQVIQGKGNAWYGGCRRPVAEALAEWGLTGLVLNEKEGLSLVNGTSVSTAMAALAIHDAKYLATVALECEALAIEALGGLTDHLDGFVHRVKNHPGQRAAAEVLRMLLAGSRLTRDIDELRSKVRLMAAGAKDVVETHIELQDPYCLRCAPQIFGPTFEILDMVQMWVVNEANSANDNPIVNLGARKVHHTGNFSGFYIALGMDMLKLAMFNIADLLHALKSRLLNEKYNRGLGASLAGERAGFNSGMKGMDIGATDIFGKVAFLANPMSLHRRATESYNQDAVSFGFGAAEYALELNEKFRRLLAETLIILAQAADKRSGDPGKTADLLAPATCKIYKRIRSRVPYLDNDRPLEGDIEAVLGMLRKEEI